MARRIAEKELETKTLEDGRERQLEDPNYRNDIELAEARAFKEAAGNLRLGAKPCDFNGTLRTTSGDTTTGCPGITPGRRPNGRCTSPCVPTGFEDKRVHMEIGGGHYAVLRVQAEDSAPVLERRFAFPIDEKCRLTRCRRDADQDAHLRNKG